MSEGWTIIGPDGTEYEYGPALTNLSFDVEMTGADTADIKVIAIRPKRKQTGWICHNACGENGGPCVQGFSTVFSCVKGVWQPFYGEVVE